MISQSIETPLLVEGCVRVFMGITLLQTVCFVCLREKELIYIHFFATTIKWKIFSNLRCEDLWPFVCCWLRVFVIILCEGGEIIYCRKFAADFPPLSFNIYFLVIDSSRTTKAANAQQIYELLLTAFTSHMTKLITQK